MASEDLPPYNLRKRNRRDRGSAVGVEETPISQGIVAGSPRNLTPIITDVSSTGRSGGEKEKKPDIQGEGKEEEEEEGGYVTPKSEEHKIPPMASCPPAPRKSRSTAQKTHLTTTSAQLFISSDSADLDSAFGSDLEAGRQAKRKKTRETGSSSSRHPQGEDSK